MHEKIKSLHQAQNMTKNELARRIGVSLSTLHNWEQGDTEPRLREVTSICRALHIDPNTLFDFDQHAVIYVDGLTEDQRILLSRLVQSMQNGNAKIKELQSRINNK